MPGEALVVGGGPAGLSAALGLAQAGWSVTMLDQRSDWPGRVCGGFLNPEGVRHLKALGVLEAVIEAGAVAVTHSRVTTPGGLDRHVDVAVQGTTGLGVPRRVLEESLLACARENGVTVRMGVRVVGVQQREGRWAVAARRGQQAEHLDTDLAVLADGRFSLGAQPWARGRSGWFGWNATFTSVPQDPGDLSMHFFPGGYFGVLTFADGSTNVCGLTCFGDNNPRTWDERWNDVLALQPFLDRLVANAIRVSAWRGVGPLPFTSAMRPSAGPILAGDAAAVGDPYMGEGISRALGTGPILRHVLASVRDDSFDADSVRAAYERIWRYRYTPRLRLGTLTRRLLGRPRLFLGALRVLVQRPRLMRSLTRVFHPAAPV